VFKERLTTGEGGGGGGLDAAGVVNVGMGRDHSPVFTADGAAASGPAQMTTPAMRAMRLVAAGSARALAVVAKWTLSEMPTRPSGLDCATTDGSMSTTAEQERE
jgi:hypothetical protein